MASIKEDSVLNNYEEIVSGFKSSTVSTRLEKYIVDILNSDNEILSDILSNLIKERYHEKIYEGDFMINVKKEIKKESEILFEELYKGNSEANFATTVFQCMTQTADKDFYKSWLKCIFKNKGMYNKANINLICRNIIDETQNFKWFKDTLSDISKNYLHVVREYYTQYKLF